MVITRFWFDHNQRAFAFSHLLNRLPKPKGNRPISKLYFYCLNPCVYENFTYRNLIFGYLFEFWVLSRSLLCSYFLLFFILDELLLACKVSLNTNLDQVGFARLAEILAWSNDAFSYQSLFYNLEKVADLVSGWLAVAFEIVVWIFFFFAVD